MFDEKSFFLEPSFSQKREYNHSTGHDVVMGTQKRNCAGQPRQKSQSEFHLSSLPQRASPLVRVTIGPMFVVSGLYFENLGKKAS